MLDVLFALMLLQAPAERRGAEGYANESVNLRGLNRMRPEPFIKASATCGHQEIRVEVEYSLGINLEIPAETFALRAVSVGGRSVSSNELARADSVLNDRTEIVHDVIIGCPDDPTAAPLVAFTDRNNLTLAAYELRSGRLVRSNWAP